MANRLANETSPYLLQHRDNPVDWYPWGEEALARARSEDRPILLSVGYSACHWCHVMEHESFADPATAALMNEQFINIKVDREERPDIDSLYMQAVQQMTGHGGWPMTVFLQPDGSPFYGGTYFPPEPRHGLPSFRQVLTAVSDAYRKRREEVDQSATALRSALQQGMSVNPAPSAVDPSILHRAFHGIESRFDAEFGGFGGAPKFPQPMIADFLLAHWVRTGEARALEMVEHTLAMMAGGGIYDHLGGGFHRYSVDARWLVPHFEKMLYDNALLTRTYLHAYQATGSDTYRETAEDVLHYVDREMRGDDGGFFSSQDADSEGEEGRFYVWSVEEIDQVLDPESARLFKLYYGVTEGGNWEGKNILNVRRSLAEVATEAGVSEARLEAVLSDARRRLYDVRARRVWPGTDDKVLTSWNAMMLTAYAEAAQILGDTSYRSIATENADFLLGELRVDGRLMRTWRDGVAKIDGFLEDYALLADALTSLYGATFDLRWLHEARSLAVQMIDLFWSDQDEMFYDTAADSALVLRPRDIYDNATPSGTSAAAFALSRLARLTSNSEFERVASRVLGGMSDVATRLPQGFGHLLRGAELNVSPPTEVVIIGDPAADDTRALLGVVRRRHMPHTSVVVHPPSFDTATEELLPVLSGRVQVEGQATAYVCRAYSCRQPVTNVEDLAQELDSLFD